MICPIIILSLKRCHDLGHAWWWMMLINLIPMLGTLLLVMELLSYDGDKEPNRFGERPLPLPVSFSYFVFLAVYSIIISIVFVFAVGRIDIVLNEENLKEEKIVHVGTNAFPIIQEAIDSLRLPEDFYDQFDKKGTKIGDGGWDENDLSKIIEDNRKVLELYEKALKADYCEVPKILSYSQTLPYLAPMRSIGRITILRASFNFKNGLKKQSVEDVLGVLRFGSMIEDSGGCVMNVLVGYLVKIMAIEKLADFANTGQMDSEQLRICLDELKKIPLGGDSLCRALSLEYKLAKRSFIGKDGIIETSLCWELRVLGYHYQPNRTLRYIADEWKELISKSRSQMVSWPNSKHIILYNLEMSLWSMATVRNSIGQMFYSEYLNGRYKILPFKRCVTDAKVEALRLLLAIRLYQQEKGQLPEKLEELVPFAIDKLPMDPLDGKPMRWSKESELIYSIGSYDSEKEAIGACVKNSRRTRGRTAFLSCPQDPK